MKKILVTGAGGPAGVNFLRSLHISNEKMELFGTDINIFHKEFAKPWTKEIFLVPCFWPKNEGRGAKIRSFHNLTYFLRHATLIPGT